MLRGRVLTLLTMLGAPLAAQRGYEARTSLRLFAGATLNQPTLWTLARQPVVVPGTESDPSPLHDTLDLERRFDPGFVFGAGFIHFPSSHLGIAGRIAYVGLQTATTCTGVYYHAFGMQHDNEALCASIQGQTRGMSLVALDVYVVARAAPHRAISPYIRAGVSGATYSTSTVYLEGVGANGIRVVIDDPSPGSVAGGVALGAGFTSTLGAGYQFHVDLGSTWMGYPTVTAPADRLAHAPTTTRYLRSAVFSFGLDVVLDGQRGRRY